MALREYNKRFDRCEREDLRISRAEIERAYEKVTEEEISDIKRAAANIRVFAQAQRKTVGELTDFSPAPGLILGHRVIPVDSCCCYVPGGGYPLYSTALMLGIPAKTAGVRRVAACSPVMKGSQEIHPKTLVAMDIAGHRRDICRRRSSGRRRLFIRNTADRSGRSDRRPGQQLCHRGQETMLRQSGDRLFSGPQRSLGNSGSYGQTLRSWRQTSWPSLNMTEKPRVY